MLSEWDLEKTTGSYTNSWENVGAVLIGGTRDIGGERNIIWNLIYQSSLWRQHQLKENRDCFESMLNSISVYFPPGSD